MWVPIPITAHALLAPGATEGVWSQVEATWERASRRWGSTRVGVVAAGPGEAALAGLSSIPSVHRERGPSFAIASSARAGLQALRWTQVALEQRRLDAVLVLAVGDERSVGALVLERQAEAAHEFVGVRGMAADAPHLRALGVPDWTWGEPPVGVRPADVFVAPRGGTASMPLRVAAALERLSGCELASSEPLALADRDARVVWVIEDAWAIPVRART